METVGKRELGKCAIQMSDTKSFENKSGHKKEGHYILIKGSLHQLDKVITSINRLDRSSEIQEVKINRIEEERDSYIIIAGAFNASLTVTARSIQKSIRIRHYEPHCKSDLIGNMEYPI